jgi:3-isopropylmalate dehydrogenase
MEAKVESTLPPEGKQKSVVVASPVRCGRAPAGAGGPRHRLFRALAGLPVGAGPRHVRRFAMPTLKFAVLAGDYIGPEVMTEALRVLDHLARQEGLALSYARADVGGAGIDNHGRALPDSTLRLCEQSDAILFGSVGGPKWEKLPPKEQPERAALLPLRKHFTLFANLRPGLLYRELADASPLKTERIPEGIDIVCIRELTGGLYFGQPKTTTTLPDGDVQAVDTMVYRKSEIERILQVAVATARARKKRLCSIDKANVLETSVLWRRTVTDYVARHAPDLTLTHMYVDNAAMQLARDPNQFDVFVTENMFGDILSDEMAVICGSLGMLSSASLGAGRNSLGQPFGLYEPAGGTAPDIAGKGIANPCAQILSAALMLRFSFGLEAPAARLEAAVKRTVIGGTRTADIAFGKPSVGTKAMTDAIISNL